jgi:hypothetical protein
LCGFLNSSGRVPAVKLVRVGRRRAVLRLRYGDPAQYEARIISMRQQQFRSDFA